MPHPIDPFETEFAKFAAQLEPLLVPALRRTYEQACEHYASYKGSNETTLGTNIYNFAIYEVETAAKNSPFIVVTQRAPLFRFKAGGYELCCHRVGQSETDDINTHFPNGKGSTNMVSGQMSLFKEAGPDLRAARQLVVAHMGNHEDGLCAVHLCIAKSADEEHITEWVYTYGLWKRDTTAVATETQRDPQPNLTPEETPEEKQPRRKIRRSDREGEG